MYPNRAARELGVLLRISQELDVVGDVTAIVANPLSVRCCAWPMPESISSCGEPTKPADRMTSLPARVPSAYQVAGLIESLMNLTEPSAAQTFTPPGWSLRGVKKP